MDNRFPRELMEATRTASLTLAEVARWMGRPYPTVIRWTQGSTPNQGQAEAFRRLDLLKKAIALGALPLPPEMRQATRAIKLRELYARLDQGQSGSDLFDIYSAA
jgi:hypothetical protein